MRHSGYMDYGGTLDARQVLEWIDLSNNLPVEIEVFDLAATELFVDLVINMGCSQAMIVPDDHSTVKRFFNNQLQVCPFTFAGSATWMLHAEHSYRKTSPWPAK